MYAEKEEIIITRIINEVWNVNSICHRYFHCLQEIILMWNSTCHLLSLQFSHVPRSKGICLGEQLQWGRLHTTHTVLYCNTPFKSKITTDKVWTVEQKQAFGKPEDTEKFCLWLASVYRFTFSFTFNQTLLLHIRPQSCKSKCPSEIFHDFTV